MCSCAFYPLHLVYSGLIWTFGVRVNYISKLFLHFLHSRIYILYILASLVSYFLLICKKKKHCRAKSRNLYSSHLENQNRTKTVAFHCSSQENVNFYQITSITSRLSLIEHRHTPHDTHSNTFCLCARMLYDSLSLSVSPDNNNHLPRRKKCPSLQVYVIHCANLSNCV